MILLCVRKKKKGRGRHRRPRPSMSRKQVDFYRRTATTCPHSTDCTARTSSSAAAKHAQGLSGWGLGHTGVTGTRLVLGVVVAHHRIRILQTNAESINANPQNVNRIPNVPLTTRTTPSIMNIEQLFYYTVCRSEAGRRCRERAYDGI